MNEQKVTVSVEWLHEHLHDETLIIIDGSWHLPDAKRDPKAEYAAGHIPGALFFDLDRHSQQDTDLPHMMPTAEQFGREMSELGISDQATIVIYDTTGLFSAARVWWMFRQFGAANSFVLDGGMPAWLKAGHDLSHEQTTTSRPLAATRFNTRANSPLTLDLAMMRQALAQENAPLILDARGAGRFYGRDPEPRAGLRGGHMPGAINLPFTSLLDNERKLLPVEQLEKIIAATGFTPDRPTIASCGSGVTAAVVLLALARLGHQNIPLYDGSWSEWGALADTPVETE